MSQLNILPRAEISRSVGREFPVRRPSGQSPAAVPGTEGACANFRTVALPPRVDMLIGRPAARRPACRHREWDLTVRRSGYEACGAGGEESLKDVTSVLEPKRTFFRKRSRHDPDAGA